jgi:glycosyltransferase involved in cell wall biosynthesis
MNKQANDNAFMLTRLHDRGIQVAVIAGRSMGLKGSGSLPIYENMDGIAIHRLYKSPYDMFLFPNKALSKVINVARELNPDLIFCSQELNMRLALSVQKVLKKPIVLLVEDAGRIFSGEAYTSLKIKCIMNVFGIPSSGPGFWSWLCEKSAALITCHPRDQENLFTLSKHQKPVYYLPWPSQIPEMEPSEVREKNKGIYVGSLYPFKNTNEFEWALPLILEKTKTEQFIVVGPGSHVPLIMKLKEKYGDAICYIDHMPRSEVMKLICSCYYAYTPVKTGGWGFIGDCWSMRTPVVMTHNDSYVIDNVNALVAEGENGLLTNINRLYEDAALYKRLQSAGFEEYEKRKSTVVGDYLYNILTSVV